MKIAVTSDLHSGISENTAEIHDRFYEELNSQSWDILILAGDLSTSKFYHLKGFAKRIRKHISRPILCVRGNHDLWDKTIYNLHKIMKDTELLFAAHDIHLLSNGNFKIINDIGFFGWDGWYQLLYPRTNDENYMPKFVNGKPTGAWLHEYEQKEFSKVLENIDTYRTEIVMTNGIPKVVCVTHMPIFEHYTIQSEYSANQRLIYFLEDKCNVLCYGHTHKKMDEIINGIRVLNSGSDYDKPAYTIFEV
jgi:predicted phosphodiesterase